METINKKIRYVFSAAMLFTMLGFSHLALADVKQCIYNGSGTSLDVRWKDQDGNTSPNASNKNLTAGLTACKTGNRLGYAVVSCNGCSLTQPLLQSAVGIGGGILLGACVAATAGACLPTALSAAPTVIAAVMAIPDSDWKKRVLVPQDGQTLKFSGTAFNLKVD